ncbi:MAG TPA: hypothetical protein VFC01_33965 [Mycobacterium sp.]|nr:hypothetical protein [Mycobacterium sp.]
MATPDRESVLNELEVLATLEHALIVEFLSIACALGLDLDAQDGGPTTDRGRDAASAASVRAFTEMFHFKCVNQALVGSGRPPRMDRAEEVTTTSGQVSPIPPDQAGFERLLEHERSLAAEVDDRYAEVAAVLTTVFDGDELNEWRDVLVDNANHVGDLADLQTALDGVAPADFLRATRRTPNDGFEERMLDESPDLRSDRACAPGQFRSGFRCR